MHELINLRRYLLTLIDPSKYSEDNSDYMDGAIAAYQHIIQSIDARIRIVKSREEK